MIPQRAWVLHDCKPYTLIAMTDPFSVSIGIRQLVELMLSMPLETREAGGHILSCVCIKCIDQNTKYPTKGNYQA